MHLADAFIQSDLHCIQVTVTCLTYLTLFLCSYSILSYVYKTLKMPAHWCIYKLMFYIYLMKYLFNISEYKAMLIKLEVGGGDTALANLT